MLPIILLSSCVICFLAYRFYGSFLSRRCELDDEQKTPAYQKEDGVDYTPTRLGFIRASFFFDCGSRPDSRSYLSCNVFWLGSDLGMDFGGSDFGRWCT